MPPLVARVACGVSLARAASLASLGRGSASPMLGRRRRGGGNGEGVEEGDMERLRGVFEEARDSTRQELLRAGAVQVDFAAPESDDSTPSLSQTARERDAEVAEQLTILLRAFVDRIGVAVPHSNDDDSDVWEVSPSSPLPAAAASSEPSRASDAGAGAENPVGLPGHVPRSHTCQAFTLHTDSSFEDPPPRYVALAVVRQDSKGGGQTCLVPVRDVLARLSPADVEVLGRCWYRWAVPFEFQKSSAAGAAREMIAPVLWHDEFIRYRDECVSVATDRLTSAEVGQAETALEALGATIAELADPPTPLFVLPQESLLFFDNARFLHARSEVFDDSRRLLRIRFQPDPQSAEGRLWTEMNCA
jgi:alpha-ketoglutarate-dependent taurine dioxygenase